ncbi:MG406 family protein [Spiroplasma tabanidicola]|uniref:MG406 family protein n=1 Tax=Spiroplasma tabanidicola TaxID=324079 RepID=A0A6I6C7T8_9MOLU|nr:MG406 family protein [Spiroplasma tabanidicola]QGS51499.1 MG406 family protein [Spiroplasma tabanidicola]
MFKDFFKDNKKNIYKYLLPVYIVSTVTLVVLLICGVIAYSWLTGFVLTLIFGLVAYIFLVYSAKKLIDHQNPYLFVFFSVLRIGLYMVPFIISIYLSEYINSFGVIIGFLISLLFPVILRN